VFDRKRCYRQLLWMRGRFTRALLDSLVWREHGIEEQKLFLTMMRSCGICFVHREAGDDTEYVALDLLPERSTVAAELAEKWPEEGLIESATFDYDLLHPGLVRAVIAEIGVGARVNALYWRGGVCVYEANTRSRALVEQELEANGRGRISVQAQGGRATTLLERLVKVVEQAQVRLSIVPKLGIRGVRSRGGEARPSGFAGEAPTSPPLDFRQPPVGAEEWYVSYAWGDATPEGREREAVVDRLCDEAARRGIRIQRDKTSLGLGDSITTFMQRIGRGDRVFVVLSEKYLRSAICMFELLELWRTSRQEGAAFLERVRVFALPDAQIDSPVARTLIAIHWKQQHAELEGLLREHGTDVIGESDFKRLRLMGAFYRDISEILATMADIVRPRTFVELAKYGFDDVVPGGGSQTGSEDCL
jgi:internalin A